MQKAFGILFIVAAIWMGLELYNEGPRAFGGLFESLFQHSSPEQSHAADEAYERPSEKMRDSVEQSLQDGIDRYQGQLGE